MNTASPTTNGRTHLTSREVADRFGLTPAAVRKAASAGRLPFIRLGPSGQPRFLIEDIERLLEQGRGVAA